MTKFVITLFLAMFSLSASADRGYGQQSVGRQIVEIGAGAAAAAAIIRIGEAVTNRVVDQIDPPPAGQVVYIVQQERRPLGGCGYAPVRTDRGVEWVVDCSGNRR